MNIQETNTNISVTTPVAVMEEDVVVSSSSDDKKAKKNSTLNIYDKALRVSMSNFPPQQTLKMFYPVLSVYKVKRHFTMDEMRVAVAPFCEGNPLLPCFTIQEYWYESPDEFTLDKFQPILTREYENYYQGFLLASVRFRSDENKQGIFTGFPINVMDGFHAFHFHQTLFKAMVTGGETKFQMAWDGDPKKSLHRQDLDTDFAFQKVPTVSEEERAMFGTVPYEFEEWEESPPKKIGSLIEFLQKDFEKKECQSFFKLWNVAHDVAPTFPVGNMLTFPAITRDQLIGKSPDEARESLREVYHDILSVYDKLQTNEEMQKKGQEFFPMLMSTPDQYHLNNYGDCTAFMANMSEEECIIKYRWHFPGMFLRVIKGCVWTITLGDTAQFYSVKKD